MNKKLLPALLTGIGVAFGSAVQASVVFDFQNGQVIDVAIFDWEPTSFVAVDGNQAVTNWAIENPGANTQCTASDCSFQLLTSARLVGILDTGGNPVTINGLNNDFEITTTFGFTEQVTNLTGTPGTTNAQAFFESDPDDTEWLNVYYDTSVDSNPLTGYGFNDGVLILKGEEVGATAGNFEIETETGVQLDQFPNNDPASDDYGDGSGVAGDSQLSIQGDGKQERIPFGQLTQDYDYFKGELLDFGFDIGNVDIELPAVSQNPSDCFTDAGTGAAVGTDVAVSGCDDVHTDDIYANQVHGGGYLPVVGDINGASVFGDGDVDFVASWDGNSSTVSQVVPEPASVALIGLGLGWMGFARRRNRRA